MNYIKLDFESILARMANERGLTVSDITGVLQFKGGNVCMVKVNFYVAGSCREIVESYSETDFERDAAKVLCRYMTVPAHIYETLAEAELCGLRTFCKTVDGVQYVSDMNGPDTWLDTWRGEPDEDNAISNDFSPHHYMDTLERIRKKRADEDRSIRHTCQMLEQQFAC